MPPHVQSRTRKWGPSSEPAEAPAPESLLSSDGKACNGRGRLKTSATRDPRRGFWAWHREGYTVWINLRWARLYPSPCTHTCVGWRERQAGEERRGADRGDRVARVCSSWVAPSEHVFLRSAPRVPGSLDLHGTPCSWAALAELEAALRCSEAAAGHVGLDSEAVYTRHTHLEANSIQINKTLWEWDSKESSEKIALLISEIFTITQIHWIIYVTLELLSPPLHYIVFKSPDQYFHFGY